MLTLIYFVGLTLLSVGLGLSGNSISGGLTTAGIGVILYAAILGMNKANNQGR